MGYNREVMYNGLNLMYIGDLIAIIGLMAGLLMLLVPGLVVLSLLILLAALVGAIVGIVGLFRLRNEHMDYMYALTAMAVGIICGFIGNSTSGAISSLFDLINSLIALLRLYLVVRATNSFLTQIGRTDVAAKGRTALYAQIVSAVVSVVIGLLSVLMGNSLGGLMVLLAIISVVGIAAEAIYLMYLKSSAEALR